MSTASDYRGRYAPSPTGPLHFGSLVAAVGSYLDARAHHGTWMLRMEDIDPPREAKGAQRQIINALTDFGFAWDGEILYQSTRSAAYRAAFDQLMASGLVYPCACSRKEIADSSMHTSAFATRAMIYPGTCRNGLAPGRTARSWRIKVPDLDVSFTDRAHGLLTQNLAREVGDFVLQRADGLWAYQLAVVVDDAAAGITDVVRGADLMSSTPRQIFLQRCLGLPTPRYLHLPVALNEKGEKLSKQTGARPLAASEADSLFRMAFDLLGLPEAANLNLGSAVDAWRKTFADAG